MNPPSANDLASAIDAAVLFLARRQQPHGEIADRLYFNPELDEPGRPYSSPFATTFALHALEFVDHPAAGNLRQRAAAFLLEERLDDGLWRFTGSREPVRIEIDPDVDDTCCVSFALRGVPAGRECTRENVAAILANRNEAGLFKTWFSAEGRANDIDSVVNANVLLYLGERPETVAARDALVGLIREDGETAGSHHYLDPLALYYAVGRAFDHGVAGLSACRNAVLGKLAARRTPSGDASGGAMATALTVCTLASFGAFDDPGLPAGLAYLIANQAADGGFARAAFYGAPPASHRAWWGSEELTTAFCLEAFGRCRGKLGYNHVIRDTQRRARHES